MHGRADFLLHKEQAAVGGALVTDPPTRGAWEYGEPLITKCLWPVSATTGISQTRPIMSFWCGSLQASLHVGDLEQFPFSGPVLV